MSRDERNMGVVQQLPNSARVAAAVEQGRGHPREKQQEGEMNHTQLAEEKQMPVVREQSPTGTRQTASGPLL